MANVTLDPGLILVHSDRAERLRDVLVAWVRKYPLNPLDTEVALVQSNGFAQWLKLSLAEPTQADGQGGCGIAAALDCLLPAKFVWQAYRAVLGEHAVAQDSPFDKNALRWRLLRLLPELLVQEAYRPLQRFLQDDADLRKSDQLAAKLAELYDQYQVYRADWLDAWANGKDVLIDAKGGVKPLEEEQQWQASLWRALLQDVAHETDSLVAKGGRAAVHTAFLRAVADWPETHPAPQGLPKRILVFGISALPRQSLEALAVLSRWLQILVCVNNPCREYWADVVPQQDLLRPRHTRIAPKANRVVPLDETQLHLQAQPLLAAWGKQGRDFIALLDEFDQESERTRHDQVLKAGGLRSNWFSEDEPTTLLGQLQNDILCLRPVHESREVWQPIDPTVDRSIVFQVAHTPQREIEVLHDQLLAALDADATLQARDILVLVPDIATYSPHIRAVFGRIPKHDPRYLPFAVADQDVVSVDPLLQVFEAMLGLPLARLGASQVLDWLEVPAVRARFRIGAEDLPLLRRWVHQSNIRWGLHDEHRRHLNLPSSGQEAPLHTWLFGLRRMLLGYASGFDVEGWNEIEAYGEVSGLEAVALGHLIEFVEHIEQSWRLMSQERTAQEWWVVLQRWLDTTFLAQSAEDDVTLERCALALLNWRDTVLAAGLTEQALPLSLVRDAWLEDVAAPSLSQRFFAGAVTFATLMPMRAIPFRYVALLGMNDGDFPRSHTAADFDLMSQDYRPGDRSRREDDRYLFLESLLSARDCLSISWLGASAQNNAEKPPSVLVGQLRDHLDAAWRLHPESKAAATNKPSVAAALTTHHPLQPFSASYLSAQDTPLFTYAKEWFLEAQPAPAEQPLPALLEHEPLRLSDLARWLRKPVEAFWTQRLQTHLQLEDPNSQDVEPFGAASGLENWRLQQELLALVQKALEEGLEVDQAMRLAQERILVIRRRGDLPAATLGELAAEGLLAGLEDLATQYAAWLKEWPYPVPGGFSVSWLGTSEKPWWSDRIVSLRSQAPWVEGALPTQVACGMLLNRAIAKRPPPSAGDVRQLLLAYLTHVAAQEVAGVSVETVVFTRTRSLHWQPLEQEVTRRYWSALQSAWQFGMQQPFPLPLNTALAWFKSGLQAEENGTWPPEAAAALSAAYEGNDFSAGDVTHDPYLKRVWPTLSCFMTEVECATFAEAVADLLGPVIEAFDAETYVLAEVSP